MMTRTQKDQVWDIIPTTFVVPSINNKAQTVTFTKDDPTDDGTGSGINDVQVLETFQQERIRYPTIQIQYAKSDPRVNFQKFQYPDTYDHTLYQAAESVVSYINVKTTPKTFDITNDVDDPCTQIRVLLRAVASSTSYAIVEVFTDKFSSGSYQLVFKKWVYPEAIASGGQYVDLTFIKPFLNKDLAHRVRVRSIGDGSANDLGQEVAVNGLGTPIHELYEPTHYEEFGNVENLIISIRVSAQEKPLGTSPGPLYYCDSDDIADVIIRDIETAFDKSFDDTVENAELVSTSIQMDISDSITSGAEELITIRQIDFLVANENRLRSQFVVPTTITPIFHRDTASDTL